MFAELVEEVFWRYKDSAIAEVLTRLETKQQVARNSLVLKQLAVIIAKWSSK